MYHVAMSLQIEQLGIKNGGSLFLTRDLEQKSANLTLISKEGEQEDFEGFSGVELDELIQFLEETKKGEISTIKKMPLR